MAMFNQVFIEHQVFDLPKTQEILKNLNHPSYLLIDKVEDVFGRVKKPYLQKRTTLNLFIGKKEGELVKPTPDAYGLSGEPHYYFIHSYNCIYECEYCYLQGYFSSPDIVLFVNHNEIRSEMQRICKEQESQKRVWFHAGEYSDSLALANITNEFEPYWDFFKTEPRAWLELRTKSANIKPFKSLEPLPNTVVSFSLSPELQINKYDRKTASLKARLHAIKELAQMGFTIGLHFDPIIYDDNFIPLYHELIAQVMAILPENQLAYVSLGVVRFTKDVFVEVQRNYPKSDLLSGEFIKSFDNKVRYKRPHRLWMLTTVKTICTDAGITAEKVYLCMENE